MLKATDFIIDPKLLQQASTLSDDIFKTAINQPNGDFFYDPWILKNEYKDTIWETLYNSLPVDKGEARIIILQPGQCYTSHADIDDRYHLNISGDECYLIDLIDSTIYKLQQDGIWYDMDAGRLHTAANFGRYPRIQLVIRKLLNKSNLEDALTVTIKTKLDNLDRARYVFDNEMSPWLNLANKKGHISNFKYSADQVKFKISKSYLSNLQQQLSDQFELILDN